MTTLAVGLMSGTSLDGVDAALVRLDGDAPTARLVAFRSEPYAAPERRRLLAAIAGGTSSELARLHVWLGRRFADATARLLEQAGVEPGAVAFVASHGQTVWHEPGEATLQLGDPAVIAERIGVTVVSDFRARDVAAGGQGAPLVPMADALLFGAPDGGRILLNVGGIANVTWVPRRGVLDGVVAFDTGPGIAVVDAVVRRMDPSVAFDVDGARAARGTVSNAVVDRLLEDAYFHAAPPKSTGRERFGDGYAEQLVAAVRAEHPRATPDDCIATALALTVRSIALQVRRWLPADGDLVISGGGARNLTLRSTLARALPERRTSAFSALFFDGDAKEAVAFALLGWLTLAGRAGNVPAATGAAGARVLGRITPA